MPKALPIDKLGPSWEKTEREGFLQLLGSEAQAQAGKIWTQSVRRNRISHPLMNFLAVFIVVFHVAIIRWNDGQILAGSLLGRQGTGP